MKSSKIILSTIALLSISAPAFAQVQTQVGEANFQGNVPAVCSASGGFVTINLGSLLDTATGGLKASQVNNQSSTNTSAFFCNGVNSTLALTASNLVAGTSLQSGAAAAGFTNQVTYRATASLLTGAYSSDAVVATDVSDSTSTAGTPDRIGLLAAPINTLQITLTQAALPSGASFLMADPTYSGSVTLTIAAQL
jgi:hypothetical protein